MWQRFTERARRVVFFAQEEAARLGENFVGTEHLLLGLLREPDSVAGRVLRDMGIEAEVVRHDVERQVTRGHGNLGQDMQLTPRSRRIIDLAFDEARLLGNEYIGTEHLLLGLIREGDGLAARVLQKRGASLEGTRAYVVTLQQNAEAPAPADLLNPYHGLRHAGAFASTQLAREDVGLQAESIGKALQQLREATERFSADGLLPQANDAATRARQGIALTAEAVLQAAKALCGDLQHFRSVSDISSDQAWMLLCLARALKITIKANPTAHAEIFPQRKLAMIFEKPSLRTRVSFEAGMVDFGGHAIYLQPSDISLGKRESIADVARNLSRLTNGIMARVFSHATIQELAQYATVPVINGLCDLEHPCQALTDFQTIWEQRGAIAGQKVVYVGDGNNVAHSLMLLGAKLGAHVVIACPPGYEPLAEVLATSQQDAALTGGSVAVTHDPQEACRDANVIYTDVWASMGQEDEAAERAQIFAPYQVNEALVALAKPNYTFLHCLPAHRGEEVTEGVLESPHSKVFDQAENRLHAQKAILAVLLS